MNPQNACDVVTETAFSLQLLQAAPVTWMRALWVLRLRIYSLTTRAIFNLKDVLILEQASSLLSSLDINKMK